MFCRHGAHVIPDWNKERRSVGSGEFGGAKIDDLLQCFQGNSFLFIYFTVSVNDVIHIGIYFIPLCEFYLTEILE